MAISTAFVNSKAVWKFWTSTLLVVLIILVGSHATESADNVWKFQAVISLV